MPILGSSSSVANKDMMSKFWTWDYNYLTEQKTLWEKEKLLVKSNFSFSHRVQPSTGETQESMNNVTCRRDMTEILLKAA